MAIIVPSQATAIAEGSAVTLARYAQIIEADECAVWGVRYEGQERLDCGTIWSKEMRDKVIKYLALAQQMIEQELAYPLMPRWIVGEFNSADPNGYYMDTQPYNHHMIGRWARFIEAGIRAEEDVDTATITYSGTGEDEDGTITFLYNESLDELFFYHVATSVEITPSSISEAGGVVTVVFPRCRLVDPANAVNPKNGWYVEDNAVFATEVDVKRVYNDPSTNAVLTGGDRCNCGASGCDNITGTACIRSRNDYLSHFLVFPAEYASGLWSRTSLCNRNYTTAKLYYKAGLKVLPPTMEDAIVRLAHALMPDEPCGCEWGQRMWRRDREVPEVLSNSRLNCPFGVNDGAWMAWRLTQRQKNIKTYVF